MKNILLETARIVVAGIAGGAVALCMHSRPCADEGSSSASMAFLASGYSGHVAVSNATISAGGTFSTESARGARLKLCTRCEDYGESGKIAFREITISPDGRILHVAEESDRMGVYTNN